MRKVGLVDYDLGNLPSVTKALERVGASVEIVADASGFERDLDAIVLPGVGHFGAGARNLAERGLVDPLRAWDRPLLGICVGLQLFFETSEEDPDARGLGLVEGCVRRLKPPDGFKVPHMGWNTLDVTRGSRLLSRVAGEHAYFVHSFYVDPSDPSDVAATTDYGHRFCAAIERGTLSGTQFHPEKSAAVGRAVLEHFVGGA